MTQTLSSQNLTLILPNWRGKGLEKCMTGFLTSTFLHLRKHIVKDECGNYITYRHISSGV